MEWLELPHTACLKHVACSDGHKHAHCFFRRCQIVLGVARNSDLFTLVHSLCRQCAFCFKVYTFQSVVAHFLCQSTQKYPPEVILFGILDSGTATSRHNQLSRRVRKALSSVFVKKWSTRFASSRGNCTLVALVVRTRCHLESASLRVLSI